MSEFNFGSYHASNIIFCIVMMFLTHAHASDFVPAAVAFRRLEMKLFVAVFFHMSVGNT
jgi:hypothetical protein